MVEVLVEMDITFITSKRGHPVLLRHGYRYHLNTKNDTGSTLWRCHNRSECSASVTLNLDRDCVIRQTEHTCEPDHTKNIIDITFEECKKKVTVDFGSVQGIFEDSFIQLAESGLVEPEDIPLFHSKRDTLHRYKKKMLDLKSLSFRSLKDVTIPKAIAENFLVIEEGDDNKMLVFCTNLSRQLIRENACTIYGDGTRKRASKPFRQIYTLHAEIGSTTTRPNIVPIVYCLLPDQTQTTYERLFTSLKEELGLDICHFKSDFEIAQINAVRAVYPGAKISGCYFHYQQAIRKKIKELNLNKTSDGRNIKRYCSYLTLLPTRFLANAWLEIMGTAGSIQNSDEFIAFQQYFLKQWVPLFPILSVSYEKQRTTNLIEGWHNRINKKIPIKPNLLLLVQHLKKEGRHFDAVIRRKGSISRKRRLQDLKFNRMLKKVLRKLEGNEIQPRQFLKKIILSKMLLYKRKSRT